MGRVSLVIGTLSAGAIALAGATGTTSAPASADPGPPPVGHDLPKVPVMRGAGGAVASVDPIVSQVGIDVLERGGNAADAAIAMAAAVGVVLRCAVGVGAAITVAHLNSPSRVGRGPG